jgi:hypothetical protein
MTAQSIASVARQVLALLGIVFGVLTQSLSTLHLPVAVSTALTVGGALILAIEQYVGDPSTGNPTTTTITSTTTPAHTPLAVVAPVAPVAPVVAPVAAVPCQGTAVPTVPVVTT